MKLCGRHQQTNNTLVTKMSYLESIVLRNYLHWRDRQDDYDSPITYDVKKTLMHYNYKPWVDKNGIVPFYDEGTCISLFKESFVNKLGFIGLLMRKADNTIVPKTLELYKVITEKIQNTDDNALEDVSRVIETKIQSLKIAVQKIRQKEVTGSRTELSIDDVTNEDVETYLNETLKRVKMISTDPSDPSFVKYDTDDRQQQESDTDDENDDDDNDNDDNDKDTTSTIKVVKKYTLLISTLLTTGAAVIVNFFQNPGIALDAAKDLSRSAAETIAKNAFVGATVDELRRQEAKRLVEFEKRCNDTGGYYDCFMSNYGNLSNVKDLIEDNAHNENGVIFAAKNVAKRSAQPAIELYEISSGKRDETSPAAKFKKEINDIADALERFWNTSGDFFDFSNKPLTKLSIDDVKERLKPIEHGPDVDNFLDALDYQSKCVLPEDSCPVGENSELDVFDNDKGNLSVTSGFNPPLVTDGAVTWSPLFPSTGFIALPGSSGTFGKKLGGQSNVWKSDQSYTLFSLNIITSNLYCYLYASDVDNGIFLSSTDIEDVLALHIEDYNQTPGFLYRVLLQSIRQNRIYHISFVDELNMPVKKASDVVSIQFQLRNLKIAYNKIDSYDIQWFFKPSKKSSVEKIRQERPKFRLLLPPQNNNVFGSVFYGDAVLQNNTNNNTVAHIIERFQSQILPSNVSLTRHAIALDAFKDGIGQASTAFAPTFFSFNLQGVKIRQLLDFGNITYDSNNVIQYDNVFKAMINSFDFWNTMALQITSELSTNETLLKINRIRGRNSENFNFFLKKTVLDERYPIKDQYNNKMVFYITFAAFSGVVWTPSESSIFRIALEYIFDMIQLFSERGLIVGISSSVIYFIKSFIRFYWNLLYPIATLSIPERELPPYLFGVSIFTDLLKYVYGLFEDKIQSFIASLKEIFSLGQNAISNALNYIWDKLSHLPSQFVRFIKYIAANVWNTITSTVFYSNYVKKFVSFIFRSLEGVINDIKTFFYNNFKIVVDLQILSLGLALYFMTTTSFGWPAGLAAVAVWTFHNRYFKQPNLEGTYDGIVRSINTNADQAAVADKIKTMFNTSAAHGLRNASIEREDISMTDTIVQQNRMRFALHLARFVEKASRTYNAVDADKGMPYAMYMSRYLGGDSPMAYWLKFAEKMREKNDFDGENMMDETIDRAILYLTGLRDTDFLEFAKKNQKSRAKELVVVEGFEILWEGWDKMEVEPIKIERKELYRVTNVLQKHLDLVDELEAPAPGAGGGVSQEEEKEENMETEGEDGVAVGKRSRSNAAKKDAPPPPQISPRRTRSSTRGAARKQTRSNDAKSVRQKIVL